MKNKSTPEWCGSPPKGFQVPEGAEPGKPFDVVCTFVPTADGKLEMTKMGDLDLPSEKDEEAKEGEESEHKPDYSGYADAMKQAAATQGQPGPDDQQMGGGQ